LFIIGLVLRKIYSSAEWPIYVLCWSPGTNVKPPSNFGTTWNISTNSSPKFWVTYNISTTTGASDFKFGAQLGFAKAHHKITRIRKGGRGTGLAPNKFHFNIYTMAETWDFKFGTQLGFAKAHYKTHPEEK